MCKALLIVLHELKIYSPISILQYNHNLIEAIIHRKIMLPDNIIASYLMQIKYYEDLSDGKYFPAQCNCETLQTDSAGS